MLAGEIGYLGPSLASCFLISGLSYKTTFNRELRISSFPLNVCFGPILLKKSKV